MISALFIVSILWGFIGYSFAGRYLQLGTVGSCLVALVMIFIVIQIERQIILSSGKSLIVPLFRTIIGVVMAVIGSVIIDQVIFKEDIDKHKISKIQEEVNTVLPQKTRELDYQIAQADSAIIVKEHERTQIIEEISRRPFVKSSSSKTKNIPVRVIDDSTGLQRDTIIRKVDYSLTDIPNPKAELLPAIENNIASLRSMMAGLEDRKINIRQELERELMEKTGFLDELNVMVSILLESVIALVVWLLFFTFFLSLEMFVLVNKYGEKRNDYDMVVDHQEYMHTEKLKKLRSGSEHTFISSNN